MLFFVDEIPSSMKALNRYQRKPIQVTKAKSELIYAKCKLCCSGQLNVDVRVNMISI